MALTDKLTAIANAIRAKTGKTESLTLEQMPTEIESITTGGGSSDDVRYVTFRNEATGEEFVKPVATGDDCVDVVAKGLWAKPTKPSDAQYDYTFYGWGDSDGGAADSTILQNITEDKTVYAIFTKTVRIYTITWLDDDGTTVLKTESLAYGAMPSYEPTKDNYTFKGWTPAVAAVTGDASYTAIWQINGWQWDLTDGVLRVYGSGAMDDYSSESAQPWYADASTITSIVIEDGITAVGAYAFSKLSNVVSVDIADSVTTIKTYAFYWCRSLKTIALGAGVTKIYTMAFSTTDALESVYYRGSLYDWCMITFDNSTSNPCISHYVSTTLYLNSVALEGELRIGFDDGITKIKQYTFWRVANISSITLSDTITEIGNSAFYDTTATEFVSGAGLKRIEKSAFCDGNLERVTIGEGVTYINTLAFLNNVNLAHAEFKVTSGWKVTYLSTTTAVSVTDPTTAAQYLRDTYARYSWARS